MDVRMASLDPCNHEPASSLVHQLINKLTVIIGGCDLLQERTELTSECLQRIVMIREAARSMAHDIAEFQCEGEAVAHSKSQLRGVSVVKH